MKKLLFVVLMAVTSATFAQDNSGTISAELKAKGVATYDQAWADMDQLLKLTPTQTSQWQALNQSYAPQYKAVLTNTSLSQTDKETQVATLHTQQEAALKTILTPIQNAEWNGIKNTVKTTAQSAAATAKANAAAAKAAHVPRTPPVRTRP